MQRLGVLIFTKSKITYSLSWPSTSAYPQTQEYREPSVYSLKKKKSIYKWTYIVQTYAVVQRSTVHYFT